MTITTEQLFSNLQLFERPVTFKSLEKFKNDSNATVSAKDIIDKIQEFMHTGEWETFYKSKQYENIVNEFMELELIQFSKNYIVYNAENMDVKHVENIVELDALIDKGYVVYATFTNDDEPSAAIMACIEQKIPRLYETILLIHDSLAKQGNPQKYLYETMVLVTHELDQIRDKDGQLNLLKFK